MSGTRTAKQAREIERRRWLAGVAGGGSECGDGRRGAQEEEQHGRQGEEDTTQTAEKSIGNGAQERAPARGEGEEPSLRSFRPLARQTALRPTQKSRAFCGARSSLHLRTDPLTRCHRTLCSAPLVRSSVRSFARSHCRLVCRCTRRHRRAGDYRGSRRTTRSPYLTRTMPCRA